MLWACPPALVTFLEGSGMCALRRRWGGLPLLWRCMFVLLGGQLSLGLDLVLARLILCALVRYFFGRHVCLRVSPLRLFLDVCGRSQRCQRGCMMVMHPYVFPYPFVCVVCGSVAGSWGWHMCPPRGDIVFELNVLYGASGLRLFHKYFVTE